MPSLSGGSGLLSVVLVIHPELRNSCSRLLLLFFFTYVTSSVDCYFPIKIFRSVMHLVTHRSESVI